MDTEPTPLEANEIHLWGLNLDQSPGRDFLLSPDERKRAESFAKLDDQLRYVSAHSSIRRILAQYLGVAPQSLVLQSNSAGKPALCVPASSVGVSFNLAHSEAHGILAVTRGRELGVDVEVVRWLDDLLHVARDVMARAEWAFFRTLPQHEAQDAFFQLWTRKEALLKAIGTGFLMDPRELDVGFSRQATFVKSDDSVWSVQSLKAPFCAKVAIAVEGKLSRMQVIAKNELALQML